MTLPHNQFPHASTPWGFADNIEYIAEGIWIVSTPSHGGIYLSPERNALVPDYMKNSIGTSTLPNAKDFSKFFIRQRNDGWYEEDCDWCIPYLVFEQEFRLRDPQRADEAMQMARDTFKQWHPTAYAHDQEATKYLRRPA